VDSSNNEIISLIPDWLALTRDTDIPLGLSREEAFRRARELRRLLRERRLPSPTSIEPDEDFKDVLHALVLLLSEAAADQPDGLLEEADAVYQFIRRIPWEDDEFDQRRSLLRRCAEIGFRSAGISIVEADAPLNRRRLLRAHGFAVSARVSLSVAREYLNTPADARSPELVREALTDADTVLSICALLKDLLEVSPKRAAEKSSEVHRTLSSLEERTGLFDEQEHLLGETARLAAWAHRFLGEYDDCEGWLDLADAAFRHTLNPGPVVANVAYARLALKYQTGQYKAVLDNLPSLASSFQKHDMQLEEAKCRFLESKTLQQLGRMEESLEILDGLRKGTDLGLDPILRGQVLVHAGYAYGSLHEFERAVEAYEEALPLIAGGNRPNVLAELKWAVGDTNKSQGKMVEAIQAYRLAQEDYKKLEMPTHVASLHLVVADSLLALGRTREAEREILAALPIIESHKMVPEGFAAVALLRESVRRSQADPNALRELREQLRLFNS